MTAFMAKDLSLQDYEPVVHAYYDRADMLRSTHSATDHAHALQELMYVNEGYIEVAFENTSVTVGRKQYIYIDAGVHHRLRLPEQSACGVMNIEFAFQEAKKRCPSTRLLYAQDEAFASLCDASAPYLLMTDEDNTVYHLLKKIVLMAESIYSERERLCSLMCAQLLLIIANRRRQTDVTGYNPIVNPYIFKALRWIEENYTEPLTVSQIADVLHVQPTYLHRLFKKHTGRTIIDHVHTVRMQKAQRLLVETDDSLLEIAGRVGIGSQQYFSRLFKRVTGVTPGAYRLLHTK